VARAIRVVAVPGAVLSAALLLDLIKGHRDRLLLPLVALLTTLSVIFLSRLDLFLATKQIMWVLMGSALMVATYFLIDDIRTLARLKYVAGGAAVALLAVTVLWGIEHHGARLWLSIPGLFSFQSGEVAKLLMAIFLAGYIADRGSVGQRPRPLAPLLIIVIFALALFVGQRDLGAAALFYGLFIAMLYLGTGRKGYAIAGIVLFLAGAVGAYYAFPHAAVRIQAWLNPWQAPLHGGYQSLQTLFCLAEGGIGGTGLGQASLANLPAASTDSILVVIGHDLGLLGIVAVVLLYTLLCVRAYTIAQQAADGPGGPQVRAEGSFGALLAAALATIFALQSLIIMGGVVRLIPLTGISLPFVSYGGTSMVVNFIAVGLLLAIVRDCGPPTLEHRN